MFVCLFVSVCLCVFVRFVGCICRLLACRLGSSVVCFLRVRLFVRSFARLFVCLFVCLCTCVRLGLLACLLV